MSVSLEAVEALREKADISYEEAKAVLEASHGDLLEALIALERQGKTRERGRGGFYSTRPGEGTEQAGSCSSAVPALPHRPGSQEDGWKGSSFASQMRRLLRAGLRCLRPGNQLEVWHNGALFTSVPLVILLLLLIFAYWASLPLLVVGLFFGCRYRLSGPDLPEEKINDAMDTVAGTVHGMVDEVKREFGRRGKS